MATSEVRLRRAVSFLTGGLVGIVFCMLALGTRDILIYWGLWPVAPPYNRLYDTECDLLRKAGRGDSDESKGELRHAIEQFTKDIADNPRFVPAYFFRAVASQRLGDAKAAQTGYSEAIDHHRATAAMSRKDMRAEKAVPLDFDLSDAYFNRAMLRADAGETNAAIADFSEALKLNPDYREAYFRRGAAYLESGNPRQAIVDLNAALLLLPAWPEALSARARAKFDAGETGGDFNGAKADARQAIQVNENCAAAQLTLGRALLAAPEEHDGPLGHLIEAFRLYQAQKPQQGRELAKAYHDLSLALAKLKSMPQANEAYNLAIHLDPAASFSPPDTGTAAVEKGLEAAQSNLVQGRLDEALAECTAVLRIDRRSAPALRERGSAFLQKSDWESAVADLDRAIDLDGSSADAYCRRAYAHLKLGDWYRARLDATAAIRLRPDDALAYLYRADANLMEKRFDRAQRDAEESLAQDRNLAQPSLTYERSAADIYIASYQQQAEDLIASHQWEDALRTLSALDRERLNTRLRTVWTEKPGWLLLQEARVYEQMALDLLAARNYVDATDTFGKSIDRINKAIAMATTGRAKGLNAQLARVHAERGYAYACREEFREVAADFKEAFRLDPQQGRIWSFAGQTSALLAGYYRDTGKLDFEAKKWRDAIGEFRQAVRFDPELRNEVQGPLDSAQRSLNLLLHPGAF